MTSGYGELDQVIDLISRMPGIGKKSAQRMALFILGQDQTYAMRLAQAIEALKSHVRYCSQCFNFCQSDPCHICRDPKRDQSVWCVVEDAVNVVQIERSGEFRGLYHVLGGVLSPVHGISPGELKIRELLERIRNHPVEEIILATNPTVEGEATAMYLVDLLRPLGIKTSRIATGVPIGGSLDYCDEVTMAKAIENRRLVE